ncbi:hypothetical protein GCM10010347_20410 [Streptomyces cirratus]|uniref:F5/8 type C domain-containing protein n=1 Tax=Streptomyces cirratus TaxID=68187 RepID=A0ABQ3ESF5_9ACTN|nr:hypothetical protein GCM10010347_20410 [Streptomyces cirratus]
MIGTIWPTQWTGADPAPPHEIQLDMKQTFSCAGLEYLPRQDGSKNGTTKAYENCLSADGATWGTAVATGTWAADTTIKRVAFATPVTARYVRPRALLLNDLNYPYHQASTPTGAAAPEEQHL